ncbi:MULTISPECIES: hypothetical protein [Streptomyces violaceusniger group]|uniref:Uncharacterized protein n=2 Tax=Streptomyces rhizosphaericus TaxID=114699 RepID=A0ABN1S6M1_9ACTN|nr:MULTISPECIES: hypothetical protein [Streptomyces violaceusniger group]
MVGIPCDATHAASAAVWGTPPAVAEVRRLPGLWLTEGWPPEGAAAA